MYMYVFVFQALSDQSSTNGQFVSPGDIQLKCNYCKSSFCSKPEVLEWEVRFFSVIFRMVKCLQKFKSVTVIWFF